MAAAPALFTADMRAHFAPALRAMGLTADGRAVRYPDELDDVNTRRELWTFGDGDDYGLTP